MLSSKSSVSIDDHLLDHHSALRAGGHDGEARGVVRRRLRFWRRTLACRMSEPSDHRVCWDAVDRAALNTTARSYGTRASRWGLLALVLLWLMESERGGELPELAGVDLRRGPSHLTTRPIERGVEQETRADQGVAVAEVIEGRAARSCGRTGPI